MNSKNIERPKVHKNIDGTYSNETKRVGFCSNLLHRGYLTKNLMEEHECIEKKCPYFIKHEKNSYWIQKEKSKEKRKKAKEERKYWENKEKDVLYYLRNLTKNLEDFCITSTSRKEKIIEARYVSINSIDLSVYKFMTEKETGIKCNLLPIKADNTKKRELLSIFNINNPEYLRENYDIKILTKEEIKDSKLEVARQSKIFTESQKRINEGIEKETKKIKVKLVKIQKSTDKKIRGFKGYPRDYFEKTRPNSISELLGLQAQDFQTIDFCDDSVFSSEEE